MKNLLRKAFPIWYDKLAKLSEKPDAWLLEKRRLLQYPRYTEGISLIFGKPFAFSDSLAFIASYEEIFVEEQYRFRCIKKQPTIIDVGSNIGLSILYFKRIFPDAQIVAFEPDAQLFELLQRNLNTFNINDIDLHNAAVWKEPGEYYFHPDYATSGFLKEGRDLEDPSGILTKAETLSSFLKRPVDLLKLDVEGAELAILKESKNMLVNVEKLIVEHHTQHNEPSSLHQLLLLLGEAGFRYYLREAFCAKSPLYEVVSNGRFDLQVNVFAERTTRN